MGTSIFNDLLGLEDLYWIGILGGVVILLLLLIICCCMCSKRRSKRKRRRRQEQQYRMYRDLERQSMHAVQPQYIPSREMPPPERVVPNYGVKQNTRYEAVSESALVGAPVMQQQYNAEPLERGSEATLKGRIDALRTRAGFGSDPGTLEEYQQKARTMSIQSRESFYGTINELNHSDSSSSDDSKVVMIPTERSSSISPESNTSSLGQFDDPPVITNKMSIEM